MKFLIACIVYVLAIVNLEACTRMFWNENKQAKIVARTMDLFVSDEPQMWLNPRGVSYCSEVSENGLEWTSLYGHVSMSAFHKKNLITDGLNENGLAVHALALTTTQYEQRDARPGIHYGEWLQYLLGTCKTVEEAIQSHEKFQVVSLEMNGFVWPLHLMIEDATGDSCIIEFVEGEMKVYHSCEYRVATNDPTFDEQLKNLGNYKHFGGTDTPEVSSDSFSRFVRASTYLKDFSEPKSTDEAITMIKQKMESLFQINNVSPNQGVSFMGDELSVSTLWTSIIDLTHPTYYFFPTGQDNNVCLDLSKLDFSEGEQVREIDLFTLNQDVDAWKIIASQNTLSK